MDEERLERLELKLAFVETANDELSAVVYRQQLEIMALQREVEALRQRLATLASGDGDGADVAPYDPLAERPPHY